MTAILAYREGKSAWIGGDGQISDSDVKLAQSDPKVWRPMPGVLSGACGSVAWCDAVAWVDWPKRENITDKWIRRDLHQSLRKALRGVEPDDSDEAIVVVGTVIYMVAAKGGVAYRLRDNWAAVGSGAVAAVSACEAATHAKGGRRVRRALEIAGKYCVGVGPPYTVLKS